MDAFRHLSRVTTRSPELGLLLRRLWFEIQLATELFYFEVPVYLGLSGCDCRPLGETSLCLQPCEWFSTSHNPMVEEFRHTTDI